MQKPQFLLLSLAIAMAVAACSKPEPAESTSAPTKATPATITIDESKLPPVNRFTAADLDPSQDACTDFNGHVNGKWLAANKIPGARTSWGSFEM
nr:peptidase [Lysobacter sp.]